MRGERVVSPGAVCLLVLCLSAGPAWGRGIIIYDTNKDPWTADTEGVDVLTDTTAGQNPANPIQTTSVKLTLDYVNPGSFFIDFNQQRASANAGGTGKNPNARGGLNFNLHATITNDRDPSWVGFEARLIDLTPIDAGKGTDDHPAYPHFHFTGKKEGNPLKSKPLTLTAGTDPDSSDDPNAGKFFVLGNGEVPMGTDLTFVVKIHEVVLKDTLRSFELELTPIPAPEPSSLTLLAVGALGVVGYKWRRRTSAAA